MNPKSAQLEARVALALCENGLSFKEIGGMLGISEGMAKLCAHKCYRRAGVTTARQFIVWHWKRRVPEWQQRAAPLPS